MSSSTLTIVHKYIRREMFDMSQRLFRAAPGSVPTLRGAFDDLAGLLREHAAMEEARLVPLLQGEDSVFAERLDREHERLDSMLADILRDLRVLNPRDPECEAGLYRLQLDWNRFVAMYLLHLDDEERVWFAPLRTKIPGAEHIAQSAAALGADRADEFLTRLWAVVTPTERTTIEAARTVQARSAQEHARPPAAHESPVAG